MIDVTLAPYSAKGDGVADDTTAFENALLAAGSASDPRGQKVFVPRGVYKITRTLHIARELILEGEGRYVSKLLFATGIPGLIIDGPTTAPNGGSGTMSTVRDLAIVSDIPASDWVAGFWNWQLGGFCKPTALKKTGFVYKCTATGTSGTSEPIWPTTVGATVVDGTVTWQCVRQDAVVAYTRCKLANLWITNFYGHGLYIYGNSGGTPSTNANLWNVDDVRVDTCAQDGFRVEGIDTNAGVARLVDCTSNGGWGFRDLSMLGNLYSGCHAQDNGLGAYYGSSVNAPSVYNMCYSEGGQPASLFLGPSIIVGGCHGAGFAPASQHHIFGAYCSEVNARNNATSPPRTMVATLAPTGGDAVVLRAQIAETGEQFNWTFDVPGLAGLWSILTAGVSTLSLTSSTSQETPRLIAPSGVQLGATSVAPSYESTDATMLTSGYRNRSDYWRNPAPSAGGYRGKVCVRGGMAAPVWQAGHAYAVGATVVPTTDNGYYYTCMVAGTSGVTAEPAWSTAIRTTFTDGSVTWGVGINAPVWQASHAYSVGAKVLHPTNSGAFWKCLTAGTSGASAPSWITSMGSRTTDGTVTWVLQGVESTPALFKDEGLITS